ncbi:acyl-homoserine-lactone synthase [Ramlibacter sp.]|uniref:acyl-homoserine-lactone synthase n=1 Tax=Ramlibacter sp. TaxID=1917967 RepID=UPI0017C5E15B|nr:acyl-homoserine-lactone synthase [Ramlibacter sp.]MBA2674456.1 GNAT family N-acetyltransferase [Ramlibacter sp.]
MQIRCYTDENLTPALRAATARYRHEVFVEQMGWELPCEPGYEQDEFDTAGATHVLAFNEDDGRIVGYGRLLPTTQTYLLEKHFASLVNGTPPRTAGVWELSRYTASDPHGGKTQDAEVGKRVLLAAMRFAAARGAHSLVCCTTVAIERLSNRWGVQMQRLGPPQRIDGFLLIAGQIAFTQEACEALGAAPVRPTLAPEPERAAWRFTGWPVRTGSTARHRTLMPA